VTDEATTSSEEEIGILLRQSRQGVKRVTVHRHINRSGEERMFIKANPVDVVVIRHDLLNYLTPSKMTDSFIFSRQYHLTTRSDKDRVKRS
jgi:hypothetical protein